MDTLQFLLFLYVQQLNRVSLRKSLIGEEWPSHRAPSPSEREAKTSSQNKVTCTLAPTLCVHAECCLLLFFDTRLPVSDGRTGTIRPTCHSCSLIWRRSCRCWWNPASCCRQATPHKTARSVVSQQRRERTSSSVMLQNIVP